MFNQMVIKKLYSSNVNKIMQMHTKWLDRNFQDSLIISHPKIDMVHQKRSDYYNIITKHYFIQNIKMKKLFQKNFKYNAWRYKNIFESLEKQENYQQFIIQNQQLFFNNVLGTMKHLLAADYIWYGRIMNLQSIEVPFLIEENKLKIDLKELILLWQSDDDKIFDKLPFDYQQTKSLLLDINQVFQQLIDKCDDAFFDKHFEYSDSNGVQQKKDAQTVFYHLINHHTHHLGQISAAYTQQYGRKDFFSTDFIYFK
ncbi:unnamed protein product [Paramecium sonneborni]|uniref:Uncharacterized protein n=1 Tax=Paramecium sonneborni TaxID=65129 RepID=A0A8S1LE81_9CILI|nr:unnamed protein product [Paramecium sonneborni]